MNALLTFAAIVLIFFIMSLVELWLERRKTPNLRICPQCLHPLTHHFIIGQGKYRACGRCDCERNLQ